ncbi:unnamed protein product [Rotaria socialis]|uniref:Uncharacterized protein n=1 Tax=Rotaria socialis TaxID=392032 RepID=A0A817ZGS4_9BILA|nr:unnamed protein product [Rotaria socialis]CAF3392112.1 unnamed protein product [Rotaria socialis]CAF3392204.1 unnamed protein product [Rotaria socialis]CAF3407195.1 unnamed protein product [Rotaria socialis]CAF3458797.1 unnamed protein product [Rotaria socialis]
MNFFDKRTPYEKAKDQTREISKQIRQEKRQLDRQINQSDREIQRLSTDIRKHAASNNKEALRTLAKTIVKIKHDKSRLYTAKANLDTIDNGVKNQLANVKITGIMQKSNEIARSMAQLMKVGQLQAITAQFSKEFIKMGIMGEMMDEAVGAALDNDDLEEETDEEVAKVLDEVLAGKLGQLPSVVAGGTVVKENERVAAATADVDSEEDEMERRLQALRS